MLKAQSQSEMAYDKFQILTSTAVPLPLENVDTDQIIPARFLKATKREGFGDNLFRDWRYNGDDTPKQDFVLNNPTYSGKILVGGRNFGSGSSREHAPWALDQYGFRAIIAPSFADIFFNNSFKNGLLPIVLSEEQVDALFKAVEATPGYELTVDLERQVVVTPDGKELAFDVQPFRKYCLLNGFDDIGLTLRHADKIKAYEAQRLADKPWLNNRIV